MTTTEVPWAGWVRGNALFLPPDLSFEEWLEVGATLQGIERDVHWWIGDWWRFGERAYGEAASQAAPTGYSLSTVQADAWVATRFSEPSRRRNDVSWSHHREVAGLIHADGSPDTETQDLLLATAASEGLSRADMRDRVRALRNNGTRPLPSTLPVGFGRADLGELLDVIEDLLAHPAEPVTADHARRVLSRYR